MKVKKKSMLPKVLQQLTETNAKLEEELAETKAAKHKSERLFEALRTVHGKYIDMISRQHAEQVIALKDMIRTLEQNAKS